MKDDGVNKKSEPVTQQEQVQNPILKKLLILVGTFCVILGVIGIFLPILPTTPFLLLAAWCYARSSDRFYHWLINNKWFGSYIKNYREGKGVPLKVKLLSISFLWLTILFSIFFIIDNLYIRVILLIIAIAVTTHIITIRTLK